MMQYRVFEASGFMSTASSVAVEVPTYGYCLTCGREHKVVGINYVYCAVGCSPTNRAEIWDSEVESWILDEWGNDHSSVWAGGSMYSEPTSVIKRLDAHRLTLDYNGGLCDCKPSDEQWLFEGEEGILYQCKKGDVYVKRVD